MRGVGSLILWNAIDTPLRLQLSQWLRTPWNWLYPCLLLPTPPSPIVTSSYCTTLLFTCYTSYYITVLHTCYSSTTTTTIMFSSFDLIVLPHLLLALRNTCLLLQTRISVTAITPAGTHGCIGWLTTHQKRSRPPCSTPIHHRSFGNSTTAISAVPTRHTVLTALHARKLSHGSRRFNKHEGESRYTARNSRF